MPICIRHTTMEMMKTSMVAHPLITSTTKYQILSSVPSARANERVKRIEWKIFMLGQ